MEILTNYFPKIHPCLYVNWQHQYLKVYLFLVALGNHWAEIQKLADSDGHRWQRYLMYHVCVSSCQLDISHGRWSSFWGCVCVHQRIYFQSPLLCWTRDILYTSAQVWIPGQHIASVQSCCTAQNDGICCNFFELDNNFDWAWNYGSWLANIAFSPQMIFVCFFCGKIVIKKTKKTRQPQIMQWLVELAFIFAIARLQNPGGSVNFALVW